MKIDIKQYSILLSVLFLALSHLPVYNVSAEEPLDIINKSQECFDFEMNCLNASSDSLNSNYTDFASKIVSLRCESEASSLANGDYAEIVSGKNKKKDDTFLKLYADKSNGISNKNIQLYSQPIWRKINNSYIYQNLNPEYNLVSEFDICSDDWNSGMLISLKMDNKWTDISINIGKEKTVNPTGNGWMHVAIVLHKNSTQYSVYADNTICVDHASIGSTFTSKPTAFTAYSMKLINNQENPSVVYIDNIEWYEKYSDYIPEKQAAQASQALYKIDYTNRVISDIPKNTTIGYFNKKISLENKSEVIVFNAEDETEAYGNISDGMRAALFNTDGTGYRMYTLKLAESTVIFDKHTDDNGCYKITASANINSDKQCRIIMAIYNSDGTLENIKLSLPDEEGNAEIESSGLSKKEGYSAKTYIWENNEVIIPVMKPGVMGNISMHPYMLVNEDEYSSLRLKAESSPWKELKETSVYDALNLTVDGKYYPGRCRQEEDAISAAALSFILDYNNKAIYKDRVLSLIKMWEQGTEKNLYDELYAFGNASWDNAIPPASALANTIIALDIIYPELTESEISEAEDILQKAADVYINNYESHYIGILGIRGLWSLYKGDYDYAETVWKEYLKYFNSYITDDGVGTAGTDYSLSRFAVQGRDSKALLPIVMEHSGLDTSFYNNEKYKNFAEWMLGFAYTPDKKHWCIGDSYAVNTTSDASQNYLAFRAESFSEYAAKQASRILDGEAPRGRLMNYLLLNNELPEAEAQSSRIFNDGGAWFYKKASYAENSISGFLWNADVSCGNSQEGHAHKETNSVNMYAYGEMLTANAGYNKYGTGYDGYTWNYINDSAISANTVLVNYDYVNIKDPSNINDHQSKSGAGILQGFTSDFIDYARGNSGEAIQDVSHDRSFILTDRGYFVLFDKVQSSPGDVVTVVHRPMSHNYNEISNTEYSWLINNSGHDVNLSIFEVSEPMLNEIVDGAVFGWESSINIKSLLAKYNADSNGISRISTILMPSDSNHPKPETARYSDALVDAAMITFNDGIQDYTAAIKTNNDYIYNNVCINAENVICRMENDTLIGYFAENATKLVTDSFGFESDKDISICISGETGSAYASEDTILTLYSAKSVSVNGIETQLISSADNCITFILPRGENTIKIGN